MTPKDEEDYVREDRQDLVARLMQAQAFAQFLLRAYNALRSYGVDSMNLPEWKDQKALEEAARMKPHAAQGRIIAYFQRLENALSAAIRRKQFKRFDFDNDKDP